MCVPAVSNSFNRIILTEYMGYMDSPYLKFCCKIVAVFVFKKQLIGHSTLVKFRLFYSP